MIATRLGKALYFLAAGSLVVLALVLLRVHRVEAVTVGPRVDLKEAGETYQQRMKATNRLLKTEKLEFSLK